MRSSPNSQTLNFQGNLAYLVKRIPEHLFCNILNRYFLIFSFMVERSGSDAATMFDSFFSLIYYEGMAAIAREPNGMWLWLEKENKRIKYKYLTLIGDEDKFIVAWFFSAYVNGLFEKKELNRSEMVRLIKLMVMNTPLRMRKDAYPKLLEVQDGNIVACTSNIITSSTLNYVDQLIEMHAAIERAKKIHEPYDEDDQYMNFAGRFISDPAIYITPAVIQIIQNHHKNIEDGMNKYM
jgi:hypothetical protein